MMRHLLKLVWNRKGANALLIAEIFFSFLVIFAVVTMIATFVSSWRRPLGFDYQSVWDVEMDIEVAGDSSEDPKLRPVVARMLDELRAMPEVVAAAGSNTPPYAFSTRESTFEIDGRQPMVTVDDVTDGFDKVMALQLVSGRFFDPTDDAAAWNPVVIDTNAARALFGESEALGRTIEQEERNLRVVGIVREFRKDGETGSPRSMMFQRVAMNGAYGQLGSHLVVRLQPGVGAEFEEKMVKHLERVAPDITLRVRHLDQMRASALRMRIAPIVLASIVATFLISMVALGLTGVLWQNVTRRTREIGLRRAMGATGTLVSRQIVIEVALLTTIAVAVATLLILQLPMLGVFGVVTKQAFALGLGGALATIYLLTVVCGLYPGWLASRLAPAEALRHD